MKMQRSKFEKLVGQAILALPKQVRQKMENIAIIVEEKPSVDILKDLGIKQDSVLLGLYQGIPKTVWGKGFGNNLPDKITIFQQPIEGQARTEREIVEIVKNTVWHEIAHHFGFNEQEIKLLNKPR